MDRVNSLARFVKRMLNFFPLFVFDYLDQINRWINTPSYYSIGFERFVRLLSFLSYVLRLILLQRCTLCEHASCFAMGYRRQIIKQFRSIEFASEQNCLISTFRIRFRSDNNNYINNYVNK